MDSERDQQPLEELEDAIAPSLLISKTVRQAVPSSPSQSSLGSSLESLFAADAPFDGQALLSKDLPDVINAVRFLSADTILNALSGHTGMPMGMAPTASVLWDTHLSFSPLNPSWINRDRFILSAGHGSMLLYSLLYMFGYEKSISMEDLKSFRKAGSRAAGHPENILTPGVEVTTGALGQGICNAVGMALAESHLAATYNQDGLEPIIDHYTYCIVGDGCLMEGISSEVCSLAGHWKLGKLIVFYDDNSISIEGSTDLSFTEDVHARFSAQGWQVLEIADGNRDIENIHEAILRAKDETKKPTLIKVKTTIGFGMPTLSGSHTVHGACTDADEIMAAKKHLGWNYGTMDVPPDVLKHCRRKQAGGLELEATWTKNFEVYRTHHPDLAATFERSVLRRELPDAFDETILSICKSATGKPEATRKLSGTVLNTLAPVVANIIGGSADLGPSTATMLRNFSDYQAGSYEGRNIHFGVREHGMGSICNGIALHGSGLIPYCSTFLVFSDYCRAAIRTAALSHAGVLFVLTHDSILLGQDGPTHQPVEHLSSLRAMPGVRVMRPADEVEVAACYEEALRTRDVPTVLALSRQAFHVPLGSRDGTARGGYVHHDTFVDGEVPYVIVISTGSELALVYEAIKCFDGRGLNLRVVSMPCVELFNAQPAEYRHSVLPPSVDRSRRLVVEAGSSFGWHKFADHMVTVDDFGLSAPPNQVADALGLTSVSVVESIEAIISV